MSDISGPIEMLETRLEALENRVRALEHSAALAEAVLPFAVASRPSERHAAHVPAGNLFPVFGKAMLGIAGAYVLRAVAESGAVPRLAVAIMGLVYAAAWLAWAAKAKNTSRVARTIYAAASSLILAPMLWELTLTFKVFSPEGTALVLAAWAAAATALALSEDAAPVLWVAQGTAACTALALLVGTHRVIAFVAALLLMVALVEAASLRNRGRAIRPVVLIVADVALWAVLFIYSGSPDERRDYPDLGLAWLLAPACVLFLLLAAGIAARTIRQRRTITVFDTIEAVAAFALMAASLFSFAQHDGLIALGSASLVLSAAGYAAAFSVFRKAAERRNFRVVGTWSAALLLAGAFWCVPGQWAGALVAVAAVALAASGARLKCAMLEFQGLIVLVAAALASGLPEFAFRALAGSSPVDPSWAGALVTVCAVAFYTAAMEHGNGSGGQLLRLVPAAIAIAEISALLSQGLVRVAALAITPDVFHVALIHTLSLCSIAMVAAFAGSRWKRTEMTRIAYAVLALVVAKLLLEDLRHGHMEFIAASIFLFAVTLIAVPSITRKASKTQPEPAPQHVPNIEN